MVTRKAARYAKFSCSSWHKILFSKNRALKNDSLYNKCRMSFSLLQIRVAIARHLVGDYSQQEASARCFGLLPTTARTIVENLCSTQTLLTLVEGQVMTANGSRNRLRCRHNNVVRRLVFITCAHCNDTGRGLLPRLAGKATIK
jgi:hypothetical protein